MSLRVAASASALKYEFKALPVWCGPGLHELPGAKRIVVAPNASRTVSGNMYRFLRDWISLRDGEVFF